MTPTQAKYHAAQVALAREGFAAKLEEIAAHARSAMLGYFADNRLTFHPGCRLNGHWLIVNAKGQYVHEELPAEIIDTLNLEVARGVALGFYMKPIERKDWKD